MRKKSLFCMAVVLCVGLIGWLVPIESVQCKEKVIELKMANYFPPPSQHSKMLEDFAKDLEMRTSGRIKIQYFTGGSLLNGGTMYDGIKSGLADIGFTHVFYTPNRMPITEMGGLPLGFTTGWAGVYALNDFYKKFQPKEFDKVKVLWMAGGAPVTLLSTKPVRSLEDLKGLVIRGTGVTGEIVKALGGTPAPTPMTEVYDALSKGVIDGVMALHEILVAFRMFEVVDYVTESWPIGATIPFYVAMNKNSYKKLPPDLKEIFDELCGEYSMRESLKWNAIELKSKQFGIEKGVEMIDLSESEVARWQNAVQPVIDDYIKRLVAKGFAGTEINDMLSYLKERIDYYTKKQIELGIPASSGPPALRTENIAK